MYPITPSLDFYKILRNKLIDVEIGIIFQLIKIIK